MVPFQIVAGSYKTKSIQIGPRFLAWFVSLSWAFVWLGIVWLRLICLGTRHRLGRNSQIHRISQLPSNEFVRMEGGKVIAAKPMFRVHIDSPRDFNRNTILGAWLDGEPAADFFKLRAPQNRKFEFTVGRRKRNFLFRQPLFAGKKDRSRTRKLFRPFGKYDSSRDRFSTFFIEKLQFDRPLPETAGRMKQVGNENCNYQEQ